MLSAAVSSDASLVTAVATAGYTLTQHAERYLGHYQPKMSSVLMSRV